MNSKPAATEEQLAYAHLLNWVGKAGLLTLVATFALYAAGVVAPHVPMQVLPQVWSMPVGRYLEQTGMHTGWAWLGMINKGDCLNFIGLVLLASVTILCFVRVIPVFFKKREIAYIGIAILEILVLLLAASGALRAG